MIFIGLIKMTDQFSAMRDTEARLGVELLRASGLPKLPMAGWLLTEFCQG